MNNSDNNIAQKLIQLHKTDRQVAYEPKSGLALFRQSLETPFTVGMSIQSYHALRSKKEIKLLSPAGVGVPYNKVTSHVLKIANAVKKNIDGNYGFICHQAF